VALRLKGTIDLHALERSIDDTIRRHEVLRTTFATDEEGWPIQVIHPPRHLECPVIDLRERNSAASDDDLHRLAVEEFRKPFDLSAGPLLRVCLVRLRDDEHVLTLTIHHIVADGWSLGVLSTELAALYGAFSTARRSPLAEPVIQYADYARWQEQWLADEAMASQLAYWRKRLTGVPRVLTLPTDRPRPVRPSFQGASRSTQLTAALTRELNECCRREDVTLFVLLLSAFHTLLFRYSGQQHIAIGTPIANRVRPEVEPLVGFFANTLVLDARLSSTMTFGSLLESMRSASLDAYANQELPFEKLVEVLQPQRSEAVSPLFQVMFVLQNAPMPALDLAGLTIMPIHIDSGIARFDLLLNAVEREGRLELLLEYSSDLWDDATAARLLDHYCGILRSVASSTDQRLDELSMLTDRERDQLAGWAAIPPPAGGDVCCSALFDSQAAQTPDAVAVVAPNERLTYRVVNRRARRLAGALLDAGVGHGSAVALLLEPSADLAVGMLGVLKAGGAWVLLDLDGDSESVRSIVEHSDVRVVVVATHKSTDDFGHGVHKIELDSLRDDDSGVEADPASFRSPQQSAYFQYAKQRCVSVNHAILRRRMAWIRQTFESAGKPVVLYPRSAVADRRLWTLLHALTTGGRIVIADRQQALSESIADHGVNIAQFLPSELSDILRGAADSRSLSTVRHAICAGEPLSPELVNDFLRRFPDARLWNVYAPPEVGFEVAAHECCLSDARPVVPVGRETIFPVHVLDEAQRPQPIGVFGRVWVDVRGERIPIGDTARRLADGNLELAAVTAERAWTAGTRVDLDELTARVFRDPLVADCAVVVRRHPGATAWVVVYVVPSSSGGSLLELERRIRREVRAPVVVVPVASIPLTADGLVDTVGLARVEVLDAGVVEGWETRLKQRGIDQVAVLTVERTPAEERLRVSELPDRIAGTTPEPDRPQLSSRTRTPQREPIGEPAAERAYAYGGLLRFPEGAPRTLTEALLRTAGDPAVRGIVYVDEDGGVTEQTYAALLDEARRLLTGLRARGLEPGDRVILQLPSRRDHFTAFWACVLGGLVPVTVAIAPSYHEENAVARKLIAAWTLLGSPRIVTARTLVEEIRKAGDHFGIGRLELVSVDGLRDCPPAPDAHLSRADDVLFFQLTSGSTGEPKCIQETHAGVLAHVFSSQTSCGYDREDVTLNWLPLDHVVPILTFHLKDVVLGCRAIQLPTERVLAEPLEWLDSIERFGVTHTWSPNFGYKLVADRVWQARGRRWDLSSVKYFMNAGEQVTLPVTREFLSRTGAFGVREGAMQPAFGMAEVCTCMTYQTTYTEAAGVHRILKTSLEARLQETDLEDVTTVAFTDLGPPSPGFEIRIADEQNRVLPEGVIGRFQIRGPSVTPGYLNNERANAEAFVGDGWFNSGDLGFILRGRLTLTGREKEMVVVRGVNLYCYEIEDVVNGIAGVEATFAAACGVPDAATGTEALAIFFVPAGNQGVARETPILIRAIRTAIGSRLGLNPLHVVPLTREEFPKTTSGKIQRTLMKQRLIQGEYRARLDKIDRALEADDTIPSWFYREVWRRRDRRPRTGAGGEGVTIVFGAESELTRALVRALAPNGPCIEAAPGLRFAQLSSDRYAIDPARADDYRLLLREVQKSQGAVDQVLYIRSHEHSAPVDDVLSLERARMLSVSGPLLLIKALQAVRTHSGMQVQLLVVSRAARAVLPEDRLAWEWSGCSALLASATQELPWLSARHVDLDGRGGADEATQVLQEFSAAGDGDVAYREGRRWVPRLEHVDFKGSGRERFPIADRGAYVVTGGLGGIGVILCRHLLQEYGAKLLVVGRTSVAEADNALNPVSSELRTNRLAALHTLRNLGGDIQYAAVDVADEDALATAVLGAEQRWGCRLDGVFHLAGAFDERLAVDETPESFAATVRSKVFGTWALARLLRQRPGSLFVGFSSVNTFFGGVRAGAYASGNQFLESYCLDRLAAGEARTYCIGWSMWDEAGIGFGHPMKAWARARGFHAIPSTQGLRSLIAMLASGERHLYAGLDGTNASVRRHVSSGDIASRELCAFYVGHGDSRSLGDATAGPSDRFGTPTRCALERVETFPLDSEGRVDRVRLGASRRAHGHRASVRVTPRTKAERRVAHIWQEVLGVSSVSVHDGFFALGGSSISALRLVALLHREFGRQIPLSSMTTETTVEQLAAFLQSAEPPHTVTQRSTLVPLRPGNSEPPLFLVHPAGGSVMFYMRLAHHLGGRPPILGFQSPGLDGRDSPLTTVERMAERYVADLRAARPRGPYALGGQSLGGLIAFEMARKLRAEGEAVPLVALLDTPAATRAMPFDADGGSTAAGHSDAFWLFQILRVVERYFGRNLSVSREELEWRDAETRLDYALERLREAEVLPPSAERSLVRGLLDVYKANISAFLEYVPPVGYSGRLTVIRPTEKLDWDFDLETQRQSASEALGWETVSDSVDVAFVAGNHLTMTAEPHAEGLALLLRSMIERAFDRSRD
jgi:non-ribosomal peptide synthetase component F/thioesterase domain-containing protein/nucleoside-diphosphate-sugar epimerase/acyl carrier protein